MKVSEKDAYVTKVPETNFDQNRLEKGGYYYDNAKKWLFLGYTASVEGKTKDFKFEIQEKWTKNKIPLFELKINHKIYSNEYEY